MPSKFQKLLVLKNKIIKLYDTYCMTLIRKLIFIVLFSFLISNFIALAEAKTIKIPTHIWSSQLVGAEIIGKLFEEVGEKVEYIKVDSQEVYESMCTGEVDIVHEIWEGAFGSYFDLVIGKECVIDLTTHEAKVREGWWYPLYVKDMCPGLPDYKALDKCSNIFSLDNSGIGNFIGGPEIWSKNDTDRIKALDMNFVEIKKDSADEIWQELYRAEKNKKPIVIFNWTPNFIEALYSGEFVEFPKYEQQCIDEEKWGINKEALYDCGNPLDGYIKIGVNKNFKKNFPRAYEVASKISFSNLDIAKQGKYVDVDGMSVTKAAEYWLDENEYKWKDWIK